MRKVGLDYEKESNHNQIDTSYKRKLGLQKELVKIHEIATEFYIQNLRSIKGSDAYKYLMERGLSSDTIKEFKIGYSPKDGQSLTKLLLEEDFKRKINMTGLCLTSEKNQLFDRFRDRIMFPIFNKTNNIIAFGGRSINEGFELNI